MKKVAMIGVGKLGQDCAEVMAQHYDVVGYDVEPRNPAFPMKSTIEEAVKDRDLIFIAAPTPHDPMYGGETPTSHLPNKDFDYTIVTNILNEVNKYVNQNQLVVLISTVLPGTVRRTLRPCITNARFIYNPYLIAMGTVKWDMVNPEMVIIGTDDGSLTGDAHELIEFYKVFMENNPRYEVGTWDEAESIKIFYNTFISTKLSLVNMIQDVAERNGNINVDVVTNALARSTHRIMGPAYMKAALGDAGACHPRDNIALRWLAQNLGLGYDLFDAIMNAREKQAELMAKRCLQNGKRVTIVGKAYKPCVPYTNGSASMLVGYYIEKHGGEVNYYDIHTGDTDLKENWTDVYLIGYWEEYVEKIIFPQHATVIDPWRKADGTNHTGEIIHYGDTRPRHRYICDKSQIGSHLGQLCELFNEVLDVRKNVHIIYTGIHRDFTFILRPFEDIVGEIVHAYNNNPNTLFVFDGNGEDFLKPIIKKIHRIVSFVKHIVPLDNFVVTVGADNLDNDYEQLCKIMNYSFKLRLIPINYFEYLAKRRSQDFINYKGTEPKIKNKKFLCFNKVHRMHRLALMDKLLENNLLEQSYFSIGSDGDIRTDVTRMKLDFPHILAKLDNMPYTLNITTERSNPTDIISDDLKYFEDSYFSVVTETVYDYVPNTTTSIFFSEKIYKPIVLRHPFVLVGRAHSLKILRKHGYKTFSPFIDESYDDIEDNKQRLHAIVREIKRLSAFTNEQWLEWQKNVQSILEHNQAVLWNKHRFSDLDDFTKLFNKQNKSI
jgi:UDPglucose 6-dehydrogenase